MNYHESLRKKIFLSYSSNIKQIFEDQKWQLTYKDETEEILPHIEFYFCPICGEPFLIDALDQNYSNPLTLEDVPPKALGGKKILLTCKICNNKLGGQKLDAKLIWDFGIQPFRDKTPNSKIDVYYNINDRATIKGKLEFLAENKFRIDFGNKIHRKLEEELEYIKNNWNGSKINFKYQAPNKRIVHIALLRIAYLLMVSHFGYGYYFNQSAEKIREQLLNPDESVIDYFGIPKSDGFPLKNRGIYFIKEPEEFKSFLTVFDLQKGENKKTYTVIIPGPNLSDLEIYKRLHFSKNFDASFELITEYSDFIYKEDKYVYNKLWMDM